MKKITKILITLGLVSSLVPSMVWADNIPVGFSATSTTQGWITPNLVSRTLQSILANSFIGSYFVGTSTATSTLAGGLQTNLLNITSTTATSTFANGVNLTKGCFAINGSCITGGGGGGGSGTVTSVTLATPNSSLTLGGTNPVTTSGTINADINTANTNWFTARQNFTSATTSTLGATSTIYFTGVGSAGELAIDGNGKVYSGATSTLSTISGSLNLASQVTGTLPVANGGTGNTTFTGGNLLYGNGTGSIGSIATTTVTCAGTVTCTTFTTLGGTPITLTGSGGGGGAGTYPFTPTNNFGALNQATTGILWFQNGENASSTSHFDSASSTALSSTNLCIGTDCRQYWNGDYEYSLPNGVTAGGNTFTLDRTPSADVQAGGFFVIDPGTANVEVRPVSSVSGKTVTVKTESDVSIPLAITGKAEFISTNKVIRFRRQISQISANGSTLFATTTSAHYYNVGDTVEITGTTNFNGTGVVTATTSTTFQISTTLNFAQETAGYVQLDSINGVLGELYTGATFTVTGSGSNNGTYTVASTSDDNGEIWVNESITSENAGNSVTLREKLGTHSVNTRAVFVPSFPQGLIPVTLAGIFPNSVENTTQAANNRKAFNRLNRMAFYGEDQGLAGIYLPTGYWFIDAMYQPESGTATIGAYGGVRSTFIKAASNFDFTSTGDVALVRPVRDGFVTRYTMDGATGRWYWRDIVLDGNNMANSNLILLSTQQPMYIDSLFLQNSAGLYGAYFGTTQQVQIGYLQALNVQNPLTLGSAAFMYVFSYNPEQTPSGYHSIYVTCQRDRTLAMACASNGGGYQLDFDKVHLEENLLGSTDSAIYVDPSITTEMNVNEMEISMNNTKVFNFANTSNGSRYSIRDVYYANGSVGVDVIHDAFRGLDLDARTFFDRRISSFEAPSDSFQNDSLLPAGAFAANYPGDDQWTFTRVGLSSIPTGGATGNAAANIRLDAKAGNRALSIYDDTVSTTSPTLVLTGTGIASTSAMQGAGLTNCNSASNALTWTSSTGLFGCNTISGSGGAGTYPFTPTANYGANNQATTGILWLQNGLNASSTSHLVYASTTALTATSICLTGDTCRTTWPSGSASTTLLSDQNTFTGATTTFNKAVTHNGSVGQYLEGVIPQGNLGNALANVANGALVVDNTLNTVTPGLYVSSDQAGVPNNPLVIIRSTDSAYNQGLLWLLGASTNTGGAAYGVKIQDGNPDAEFVESDQTSPAGKYEIDVNNDTFRFNGRNSADNSFDTIAWFTRNDKDKKDGGGRFCIGCSSVDLPGSSFNIVGTTTQGAPRFTISSASTTAKIGDVLTVLGNGNLGVGTTTPGTALGVTGNGVFTGQVVGINFLATSTTASSTFQGVTANAINIISTSASSTAANGINLTGGCFAINGSCISGSGGGGSGTVNSGTQGQTAYYATAGTAVSGTSTIFTNTNSHVGLGTTTLAANTEVTVASLPTSAATDVPFQVVGLDGGSLLTVKNNGRVGLSTASPCCILDVNGIANATSYTLSGNVLFNVSSNFLSIGGGFTNGIQGAYVTAGSIDQIKIATFFAIPNATNEVPFKVWGLAGQTADLVDVSPYGAANNYLTIKSTGSIGIGTTTPFKALSVAGAGGVAAESFTATSTTATSTFSGGLYVSQISSTTAPYIYSKTSGFGGHFIMENEGGGTCTEYTSKPGAAGLRATTVNCPPEI